MLLWKLFMKIVSPLYVRYGLCKMTNNGYQMPDFCIHLSRKRTKVTSLAGMTCEIVKLLSWKLWSIPLLPSNGREKNANGSDQFKECQKLFLFYLHL